MSDISDEMLMAYVDGELDAVTRRGVEGHLAINPEARRRLDVFKATGPDMARMFDAMAKRPVPAHLIETIETAPLTVRTAANSRVPAAQLSLMGRLARSLRAEWPLGSMALAFSTLLVIGASAAWYFGSNASDSSGADVLARLEDGRLAAGSELGRALEATPSGTVFEVATRDGAVSISPVWSFKTKSGGFCRQYETSTSWGGHSAGVGCRQSDGQWQIEAHTQVAAKNSAPGDIKPAAGAGIPDVDHAVDRLIAGETFVGAAEARLIKNGWRGDNR